MKSLVKTLLVVALSLTVGALSAFYWSKHSMTTVHRLTAPLLVNADGQDRGFHLLPKGTLMYFDKSYPEGFTRYKIYVNVDRMPLKNEPLSDPTLIEPIEASSIDGATLSKILKEHPIRKDELAAIIKTNAMSKDEIKAVLEDYLKN
jgi:hypothetical protein